MKCAITFLLLLTTTTVAFAQKQRARDLGIPFEGTPGKYNFGAKRNLTFAGVPVVQELKDTLKTEFKGAPAYRKEGDGSIIVVVAIDAPLLPRQLKRIAACVAILTANLIR